MSVTNDPAPSLQAYAHPEKLVTTEWLAENLGMGKPGPGADRPRRRAGRNELSGPAGPGGTS